MGWREPVTAMLWALSLESTVHSSETRPIHGCVSPVENFAPDTIAFSFPTQTFQSITPWFLIRCYSGTTGGWPWLRDYRRRCNIRWESSSTLMPHSHYIQNLPLREQTTRWSNRANEIREADHHDCRDVGILFSENPYVPRTDILSGGCRHFPLRSMSWSEDHALCPCMLRRSQGHGTAFKYISRRTSVCFIALPRVFYCVFPILPRPWISPYLAPIHSRQSFVFLGFRSKAASARPWKPLCGSLGP